MKILICDDHPAAISIVIEHLENYPLFKIIATASTGFEAVEKYFLENPDVVIMDISMPEMNGIEAAKKILERDSEAKILFYSMNLKESEIYTCYKIGAAGFVSKESHSDDIIIAINKIKNGERYFGNLFDYKYFFEFETRAKEPVRKFSFREKDIIHYLAKNYNDKKISEILGVELKIIENLKVKIKQKLSLESMEEVKEYALKYTREEKKK